MKLKLVSYGKKGTYCLRCGMDKKEIRKEKHPCCVYGRNYKTHLYK
jgi:ribosomal protein L37E